MDTPEASPRKSTKGPLSLSLLFLFHLSTSSEPLSYFALRSAMEGEDLVTCVVTEVEKRSMSREVRESEGDVSLMALSSSSSICLISHRSAANFPRGGDSTVLLSRPELLKTCPPPSSRLSSLRRAGGNAISRRGVRRFQLDGQKFERDVREEPHRDILPPQGHSRFRRRRVTGGRPASRAICCLNKQPR